MGRPVSLNWTCYSVNQHSIILNLYVNPFTSSHCWTWHAKLKQSLNSNSREKMRLLFRFVNPHVRYKHFQYEDWSVVEQVIRTGCWFFNWDFTSGNHHVAINPLQCKYLGFPFHWPVIGHLYFNFTQIPFDLNWACYSSTKLTRPLLKYWREVWWLM